MRGVELLAEGFGRLPDLVDAAVEGLSPEQLTQRVDAEANPIAWLVWHLARVQDDHLAEAFDVEQRYTGDGNGEQESHHDSDRIGGRERGCRKVAHQHEQNNRRSPRPRSRLGCLVHRECLLIGWPSLVRAAAPVASALKSNL